MVDSNEDAIETLPLSPKEHSVKDGIVTKIRACSLHTRQVNTAGCVDCTQRPFQNRIHISQTHPLITSPVFK